MKTHWLWDTSLKESQVIQILHDEKNPRFYIYAEKLFSRITDPAVAFTYMDKKTFCRKWPMIKKRGQRDVWARDKMETWQKIYETILPELKLRGFKARRPAKIAGSSETLDVAQQIRDIRTRQGYTQTNLAQKLGVIQQYVAKVEAGGENISIKTLKKFAKVLGKKLVIKFQ